MNLRPRLCLHCKEPFLARYGRSTCSVACGQQLRRLRELDWGIRHAPILRLFGEKKYPAGFVRRKAA